MTWTWTEVISLALVRSGMLGRGQIPDAGLQKIGLDCLYLLLDEFDGQGLALPDFDSDVTFSTVANQARYLLGTDNSLVAGASGVRPETIITATVTLITSPVTRVQMVEMSYEDYTLIPVPEGTTGQPWNYAVNQKWPQMELFLYPTPSQVYPITLNCKIRWLTSLGSYTPGTSQLTVNPFQSVDIPSGYVNALVDNLALRIAENYRLETATLQAKANKGRFTITQYVYAQQRKVNAQMPVGVFPWVTGMVGRNP